MVLKLLKLVLQHDDWSKYLQEFPGSKYIIINSLPLPSKDTIQALVKLETSNKDLMKTILKKIKEHSRTKNVEVLNTYSAKSYTMAIFKVVTNYKGSIIEQIINYNSNHDYKVLTYQEYGKNGLEYWSILIYNRYINDFVHVLNEHAEIVSFNSFDGDLIFNHYCKYSLTPYESYVLKVAYKSGYFEWPKKATSEDIAKILNISKSTFTQILRNALRKIIAKELLLYNDFS
jgi:predicted DNA binding protein